MTESHKILDLSSLPEQARTEVNREQDDDHRRDFIDLFGVWSESDFREFSRSVEEFDEIDPEDWH